MAENVTNSGPGNRTAGPGLPGLPQMTTEDIVADVFFCILAAMIVFGNSLVIGAFRVNRRLRTTTNLLLMSLAVADMLIGTISLPLWVYISITYKFKGTVYKFFMIFDVICGVSSILNLTAISLERCYALLSPIKHRNIRKRVVLAIIFLVWVLSTIAGTMIEFLDIKDKKFYGVIVTVAFFFVPLTIILGAYGTIFQIARAHARGRGVHSFKKDLRIATTVAVVIGLFIICWTPFFALNFAFAVCGHKMWMTPGCLGLKKLPPVVLKINKWLQYGNSVCNPIIYGLRNKDFRRAFRKILLGLCCKKVRLSNYSQSAYGRTVRAKMRRESSFENSRSVIYPPQLPSGMFDMRESYRKAIQSGRSKPIKLKFTKKSLADGLLALNVDAFHSLPAVDFTSTTNLWTSSSDDVTASSAELCNPAFEDDQTETGIYPIDQAIPDQDYNDNVSNNSLHKSSPKVAKGSMQNGKTRVHFTASNSLEKDEEESKKVSSLAPFDRKRSLSEIFIRSSGETDSLKQKLRSSFS